METTFHYSLIAELALRISGSVIAPGDADYQAARAVHNGLVNRRPALIVRCRTTKDVVTALAYE